MNFPTSDLVNKTQTNRILFITTIMFHSIMMKVYRVIASIHQVQTILITITSNNTWEGVSSNSKSNSNCQGVKGLRQVVNWERVYSRSWEMLNWVTLSIIIVMERKMTCSNSNNSSSSSSCNIEVECHLILYRKEVRSVELKWYENIN